MFYSTKPIKGGHKIKIDEGGISCMSDMAGKQQGGFTKIAEEIQKKNAKKTAWNKILIIVLIMGFLRISLFFLLLVVPIFYLIDRKRKTIRLSYEIDEMNVRRIQKFYGAFDELKKCKSIWNVFQDKGNALKRENTFIFNTAPVFFKTNVKVPKITVTVSKVALRNARKTIYFMPDRLYVVNDDYTNFIDYKDIQIEGKNSRHIETGAVLSDAAVLEHVYINGEKANSADSKEKKYPVCNYTVLNINSDEGLHERLQFSMPDLGKPFVNAFNDFVKGA
jgi:hypothetical protein